jgi:hypothetical protein
MSSTCSLLSTDWRFRDERNGSCGCCGAVMMLDLTENRLAQTYLVTLLTSVLRTVSILVVVCNSTVVVLSVTTVVSILVDVAVTVVVGSVVLIIN